MSRSTWDRPITRAAVIAAGIMLLAWVFRDADPRQIGQLLTSRPALSCILLPFLLTMGVDTLGWRRMLAVPDSVGTGVRFRSLYAIRLSTEALNLSLPTGAAFADPASVLLLRSRCGVPAGPAAGSLAARRFYILVALALMLTASAVLGHSILKRLSPAILGNPGLEWLALGAAATLALLALILGMLLTGGSLAERLRRRLQLLPSPRLRAWLHHRAEAFTATDHHVIQALGRSGSGGAVLYVLVFIVESLETFLLFTLLGAGLSYLQVLSFETLLVLVRTLAFFVPSGLGIQDAGYLAFLQGLAIPEAPIVGAAFVLAKRGKELFWIALGYLILSRLLRVPRDTVTTVPQEGA